MSQKTVLYSDIDGYQIVKGFAEATVDPVKTLNGIADKITSLDELARVNSCKAKIAAQLTAAQNYYNLASVAIKAGNTTQATSYQKQYEAAEAQIAVYEEELATLMSAYESAKMALYEANPVYSQPGPGEAIIDDSTYTALQAAFDALAAHHELTIAGASVVDYSGETYWLKTDREWSSTVISALGVSLPDGAVLAADLTDDQRTEIVDQIETARIAALSEADKLTEAESAQAAAKTAAAAAYNEGLIEGKDAATALSDSQTQYKAVLAEINTKFGTSLS